MDHAPLVLPVGNFRAFLFDLDGTVADSMPVHYRGWVQALAEFNAVFPEPLFYEWGGIPPARIVEMLNEKYGHTLSPAAIVARKESLYFDLLPELQPVASVLEHIQAFAGKVPFAIVSGSPRESIRRTLETLDLTHHFPVIVGAEDYTEGKPHPEPFLKAASLLGVEPAECLVFEDAEAGITSAKAAGMAWVRVPLPALQPA